MNAADLIDLEFGLRKQMNFILCDDVRERLLSNEIGNKEDGANFIMSKKKCVKSLSKNFFSVIGDLKIDDKVGDHDGWFICNGRELDRKEYAELFAIIGTGFGAGDGKTTFNLPDCRDKKTWKNRTAKDDVFINDGMPHVAGCAKSGVFVPACNGTEMVLPDPLYLRKKFDDEVGLKVFIFAKKKMKTSVFKKMAGWEIKEYKICPHPHGARRYTRTYFNRKLRRYSNRIKKLFGGLF